MKHLWEIDHPYHCSDTNYWVDGRANPPRGQVNHESWKAFHDEMGDADPDLNLVFRWDWKRVPAEDYDDYETPEDVPGDTLNLYYMQQRKGNFVVHVVQITEDDEPAVRSWLTMQGKQLVRVWEPFLGVLS